MTASDEALLVRMLACGFFHPPDQFPEELIDASRFHHVPLPGCKASAQFFLMATWSPGAEPLLHIVIMAHFPRLDFANIELLRSLLARSYPGRPALFSLEVRTGFALIDAPPEHSSRAGAAAVAVLMAAESWDESDPIVIEVVNLSFAVYPVFEGKNWRTQVKPWLSGPP